MLTLRRGSLWLATMCAAAVIFGACTSSESAAPVESTTTTTTELPERPETIRIGIAVNEAAPTAAFDAQIESILTAAADTLTTQTGINVDVRTVSIETSGQAQGTILSLINDGVTVVVTGCDDATIPSVVEAATSNGLLAVTGCVSLPRPDIARLNNGIDARLFLDLSSLSDNARAIARHAEDEGFDSLGIINSNLLPDVERTCNDLGTEVGSRPAGDDDAAPNPVEVTFTELVDAPSNVVDDFVLAIGEGEPDAIVVCALAPTVGDLVSALREAGLDQPVLVPWYGDGQIWSESTNNVFVLTPASRFDDDPEFQTAALFDTLIEQGEQPDAVDVVTADTLAILTDAAVRTGSVGSERLAEAIRTRDSSVSGEIAAVSGGLHVGGDPEVPVRRVYRVISIEDGTASFLTEASALDGG